MANFYFTNKAVEDLNEIWEYSTEIWSENQADKYYNLLMGWCYALAENPSLGKLYDIISLGVLGYKSGEHLIFYRIVSENEIEIIRILHGMMDLKSKV